MPELPEIETLKRGLSPFLISKTIKKLVIREQRLRTRVPASLSNLCKGQQIQAIKRRAKYLLLELTQGFLVIHLGMSGTLQIVSDQLEPKKHDHIDLILKNGLLVRYRDPRRFGLYTYLDDYKNHPLFNNLGPEPLEDDFNSDYFLSKIKKRKQAIKNLIMNNEIVVGVGNIYATESLYFAGIHPQTPACFLPLDKIEELVIQIKRILNQAIQAGGTTLKDFMNEHGKPGYFSQQLSVYGRGNFPCYQCQTIIQTITIGGRSSSFCPYCQPSLGEEYNN